MEARLSLQSTFKVPAEVEKLRKGMVEAKSWVSMMKASTLFFVIWSIVANSCCQGEFQTPIPNPPVDATVAPATPKNDNPPSKIDTPIATTPLFNPGALTDDELVDELPDDSAAIISRREAKNLGGVGIADTYRVAMPSEYEEGTAYHIAGVVYVNVSDSVPRFCLSLTFGRVMWSRMRQSARCVNSAGIVAMGCQAVSADSAAAMVSNAASTVSAWPSYRCYTLTNVVLCSQTL